MATNTHGFCPDMDENKRLINEKACLILEELTQANLDYFVKEAVNIAKDILKKYVFSIRKFFSNGEFAIKDLAERERFTNFRTGYQQKMLDWIDQYGPNFELDAEIPAPPQKPVEKKWHYVTLGVGTAGALGFEIGRRCMEGHRYWIGIAIELSALVVSYVIYKKEQYNKENYSVNFNKYKSELNAKREAFINETINQLENWIKTGESYSNELLTTFNL